MGYDVEEKKAKKNLIRQALPKKSKIKEDNDVDDKDDEVTLPISTTVTLNHNLQSHAALLVTGQLASLEWRKYFPPIIFSFSWWD